MFIDAVQVKIRNERIASNGAVDMAIGDAHLSGYNKAVGLEIKQSEGRSSGGA